MFPEAIRTVSGAVQPLVFETGIAEAPYSTAGTAFLVGHKRRAFVVTARHLLRPEALTPLCIFPSDISRCLIPLQDVFYLPIENVSDDFADFAIIEIDRARLDAETLEASVINLALAEYDWLTVRETSRFVALGYPLEHSFVDYERELVTTKRFALQGKYAGAASSPYLHEILVEGQIGLRAFRGFSGGPVFSWHEYEPGRARIALCGMLVKGSIESRCVRFIEWSLIRKAIDVKIRRPISRDVQRLQPSTKS